MCREIKSIRSLLMAVNLNLPKNAHALVFRCLCNSSLYIAFIYIDNLYAIWYIKNKFCSKSTCIFRVCFKKEIKVNLPTFNVYKKLFCESSNIGSCPFAFIDTKTTKSGLSTCYMLGWFIQKISWLFGSCWTESDRFPASSQPTKPLHLVHYALAGMIDMLSLVTHNLNP